MEKYRKIFSLVVVLVLISACGGVKRQYKVIDVSSKQPDWVGVRDVDVLQKKLGGDFVYVVADAESVSRTICEREAKAKGPVAFKEQITQSMQERTETIHSTEEQREKAEKMTRSINAVAGRIAGVKVKDTYWEKRRNDPKLGADDEKVFYHCYALFSMEGKKLDALKNAVYQTYLNEINVSGEQSIKNDFMNLQDR